MSEIAGMDITPNSGTTLRKVLKLNLGEHMDQFEGIRYCTIDSWSTQYSYCFMLFIYEGNQDNSMFMLNDGRGIFM